MNEWPNYEIYHTHELEAALKNISESENSDEANHIRKLIEQGGYKPSEESIEPHEPLEALESSNKKIANGAKPTNIAFHMLFSIGMIYYGYTKLLQGSGLTAYMFVAIGIISAISTVLRIYIANKHAKNLEQ